ncbi:flavin reductase (DIM6/NTAB) family NADH-FMN oxidoreductase RutF [Alkalibacillus filiformis]|uniref:Flavin reductase (DIM6/NTAB) family NADH-FMN oxidoreductase RutF n=1 Tax=Alkalibacillus filiformis TaxID=200990 RepID=A0ABU0DVH9_9BACI|nr:flavin reductase family protein [Alkalibacillus filiformis]MDQ0352303.1 flavin reductase (DIM6/NTAB) family NADH-FMN oxidoreductase RutF [Alkalibacillus filiformis]
MDQRDFRNCMGKFATGVTVVTCEADGHTHGFTVNSFTSVSLEPPLVLVSVDRNTKALEKMRGNHFIVNVLKEEQQQTAIHFAGKPNEESPFEWETSEGGQRIKDSLAHIECAPWAEYDGGDHVLFIGEVENYDYDEGEPLGYYCGQFSKIVPK